MVTGDVDRVSEINTPCRRQPREIRPPSAVAGGGFMPPSERESRETNRSRERVFFPSRNVDAAFRKEGGVCGTGSLTHHVVDLVERASGSTLGRIAVGGSRLADRLARDARRFAALGAESNPGIV